MGSAIQARPFQRAKGIISIVGILCAFLLALSVLFGVERADAKSYECPDVDIHASLTTDDMLSVVEHRTFSFDGSFTAVWWELGDQLPENAYVLVNEVDVLETSNGIPVTALTEVPFQTSWRTSGGPSIPAWSFDAAQNTVYAFFEAEDEDVTFQLAYDVENAAQIYDDAAELYWAFVGSGWSVDSENVTLELTLPQPEGATAEPGVDVRAWGHGPLDGNVDIDGDTINYTARHVPAGDFAEARVLFPSSWLPDAPDYVLAAHAGETVTDSVLAEEQAWADQANQQRAMQLAFLIGLSLFCIAIIIVAVIMFFRHGKEHKPDFTGDYWRDVPQPGVDPAVIGRLWRWDKESPKDLTATIISLCANGALRLDVAQTDDGRGHAQTDYQLTRMIPEGTPVQDELARATLDLLFDKIGEGSDSLLLGDIQRFGKDHPQEYVDAMAEWQGVLSSLTNEQDYFEMGGFVSQGIWRAIGIILIVGGIALSTILENFFFGIIMVPTAIVVLILSHFMQRRSQHGADVMARAEGLKRWLTDFSALNERPPMDVKVWGVFMVYAFLFGVADRVIKELRDTVPEVFVAPEGAGDMWVPWYVWYWSGPHMYGGGIADGAASFLDTALSNTAATAHAALSAASGDGFSSGGGFGGGFSVGGGGGFGGGGGAR